MTETTYTCDRCDAPIVRDRVKVTASVGRIASWPLDPRTGRSSVDLCGTCAETLAGWLVASPATARDGKAEAKPKARIVR